MMRKVPQYGRVEVLTAARPNMNITAFWDVTSYNMVKAPQFHRNVLCVSFTFKVKRASSSETLVPFYKDYIHTRS
jgi:hypothetical protein